MKIPIDSYEEFTRHLADREYFGQKLGLERIRALLRRLGDPHERFRCIHIAGTNGKGSTAAMLAGIFQEAGCKTGLYSSPHLEDFCERIRVDGRLIRPDEVLRHAGHIREIESEPLTFFEFATAIGFLHFAEAGVDLAIVETGLGGRLDATNIVTPMLSVITTIGRDHTAQLGESLEEVAYEKAGIIKSARPVLVGPMPDGAREVIREQASVKNARFVPVYMDMIPPNIRIGLEGSHQRRNANLAVSAIDVLNAVGEIRVNRDAVWRGLENVRWPGRLETVSEEPWILLDGAHNPDAMRVVREFLEERLEGRRLKVLFGAMADKDLTAMLSELAILCDEFVFAAPRLTRAADPRRLAEIAGSFEKSAKVAIGIEQALESVLNDLGPDEVLLVTGSFYLVGEVRAWLEKNS